jgi:hypothetical protein
MNTGENGIDVVADVFVNEANDANAERLKNRRPPGVIA